MAVRYSGEVEIRVRFVPRRSNGLPGYEGVVRAPGFRTSGVVLAPRHRHGLTPAVYDHVALLLLSEAVKKARGLGLDIHPARRSGKLMLRRIFQSPCPVRDRQGRIRLVQGDS